jgi:nucleotide-binding universal stress UspA family protein
MFKAIVVGVDGREGGRDALSLAARLALLAGGELIAVRALSMDTYVVRGGAPKLDTLAQQDAVRDVERELTAAGITAQVRVVGDSSPARALHRVAEAGHADVIVVGSTHHGTVGRVLAGDDAAATLHGSPCPVAVAPHGLAAAEWRPVQTIGVGYDAGPEAQQALALAAGLARECGASLALRSVVGATAREADASTYDADWLERAKALATEQLDEARGGLPPEATGDVVIGRTVDELVRLTETVDLLVVGSRAWGPVRRIVLGSTAAYLMRAAHAPVLVLPRGAATGQPGETDVARDKTPTAA